MAAQGDAAAATQRDATRLSRIAWTVGMVGFLAVLGVFVLGVLGVIPGGAKVELTPTMVRLRAMSADFRRDFAALNHLNPA